MYFKVSYLSLDIHTSTLSSQMTNDTEQVANASCIVDN